MIQKRHRTTQLTDAALTLSIIGGGRRGNLLRTFLHTYLSSPTWVEICVGTDNSCLTIDDISSLQWRSGALVEAGMVHLIYHAILPCQKLSLFTACARGTRAIDGRTNPAGHSPQSLRRFGGLSAAVTSPEEGAFQTKAAPLRPVHD